MKPKILVYSEIFPPKSGGSGRWFFELYSRISGISPIFLVGKTEGDAQFDQQHPDLLIERYQAKPSNWGFTSWPSLKEYWRQFRLIAKKIKKSHVQEVHCCRILPEGVPAMLAKIVYGTPFHCYIHGEDIEVARTSRELTLLTKCVMRFASKLICNSETTKGYVTQYWSAYTHKAIVLHPGVDTDYFCPAKVNTGASFPPKQITRPLTLLTVGRLQRRKGHDVVIKALARLKGQGIIYQYNIAGSGEEKTTLQQLVTAHKLQEQVTFLQEITDESLKQHYQHCDVFILANRRDGHDDEGFGMVLLEAQACETAVIAGRSGGTWETLQENTTGWLLDCTNENELVALLSRPDELLQKQQSFGAQGRKYVLANYSWPVLTKKACEIFGWNGV